MDTERDRILLKRAARLMRMQSLAELINLYIYTPEEDYFPNFWEYSSSGCSRSDVLGLVGICYSIPQRRFDKIIAKLGELTGTGVAFDHQEFQMIAARGYGKYKDITSTRIRIATYLGDISEAKQR